MPAILEIDNVDPVIFRQLLEYIYTKSCQLLQEGPCAIAINVPDSNGKNWFTIGVSANIIDASFKALVDSLDYKLFKDNAPASL